MNKVLIDKMRQKLIDAKLWPLEVQANTSIEILKEKLDKVLPWAMESTGIDFWIVMGKENNEDPIMKTLFTWDMPTARRVSILAFYYDHKTRKVRKMMVGNHSPEMNLIYENVQRKNEDCWTTLNRIIEEINPKAIAVNQSDYFGFCDGLTVTLYENFISSISETQKSKLCSAEKLSVKWLQKITDIELNIMKALVDVTTDIIKITFNKSSIEIGKTTTTDLEWLMRNTMSMLGLDFWFGPDIDLQRKGNSVSRISGEVIKNGDFLHCDVGVYCRFINLHTDMQWVCYVKNNDEDCVPEGLTKLLEQGNRLQDIVMSNFSYGKTGNDVFKDSISQAQREGITPMIYTHPLGTFGHGAGTTIGMYDTQGFIEGPGEVPIENNTCYALELNVCGNVPEWDNQNVYMYLEEDIYFNQVAKFVFKRQIEIIEI